MDELDKAKEREMLDRELALQAQLAKSKQPVGKAKEKNGKRYCLDCDSEIDPQRLKARPESVLCVYCKQKREKEQRIYA